LESGEIALTGEDAHQLALALGTPEAAAFASYLDQTWKVLPKPGFRHRDLESLWAAERAMQRLDELRQDPQLKNAFLQQVSSYRGLLERCSQYLLSTEHQVAFFGSPGVGKTTLICALSGLRNREEKDLSRQMVLQTGSGRTTVCEVHVRAGGEYGIFVDPCTQEEMRQYVVEFCDQILSQSGAGGSEAGSEGAGVSAEVERALRNMAGLTIKKVKDADGKFRREDPASQLVSRYSSRDDLLVEVMSRLELGRRTATSVCHPRDSLTPGLEWIGRTFADINYGHHPQFSLPRRVEITLPGAMLGVRDLDVRLIDTRGIDEPAAPRRDVQLHLDNERTVAVFCSAFKSAPDAAAQSIIERGISGGNRDGLVHRSVMVVLPQEGEEAAVRDSGSGDLVSSAEEGRETRRDQVGSTLGHLGVRELAVEFVNVRSDDDCDAMQAALSEKISQVRRSYADQIHATVIAVDHLIQNKASEQLRAVYLTASRPLRVWFANNRSLPESDQHVQESLLEEIDGLRYASSLRASVNRHGSWHNFDYWHGLGFGARRETVARSAEQVTILKGQLATSLQDEQLEPAHDFLRQFQAEIDRSLTQFYQDVQALGESAFLAQLQGAQDYWTRCASRWGGGPGYKSDIKRWTESWFSESARAERHNFIESEIQRRWSAMVGQLDSQVAAFERTDE